MNKSLSQIKKGLDVTVKDLGKEDALDFSTLRPNNAILQTDYLSTFNL